MKGLIGIMAWLIILSSFIFSTNSYGLAELPPPDFSIVEIETAYAPNFVAHKIDDGKQYMVVVEPHLIEVYKYSLGSRIELADSESSNETLNKCAIGNFNNDEYWDLAATEIFADKIGIWLGTGEGNLYYYDSFDTEVERPDRVVTGDFDEDGYDDLLITSFIRGKLIVMLNDGQGNFSYHTEYSYAGAQEVTIADFNGDEHLDYIITEQTFNKSTQRFGDGNGYFYIPQEYSIYSDGYTSSLADMDGDGIRDYVCGTGRDIRLFKGKPTGLFRKTSSSFGFGYGAIQYRSVVGDFNGDGNQDVCSFITGTNDEPTSELQFWYGNGAGNLEPSERLYVEGITQAREVWPVAADLNNDSKTDILITCNDSNDPYVKVYIME